MVIGVTVGIGTVDLNCLIVSSSRSTSPGQSWSVVVFSAVATARNSIRKTWTKRRGGAEGEGVEKKEREREREKSGRAEKRKKMKGKKSRARGEGNAREAYDLERREGERWGEEGHRERLKSKANLSPVAASDGILPLPLPPSPDWFTTYSLSTIHYSRIYKMREFYEITQPK